MFNWKKEFELGIPSIDEQHKRLLAIGNRVDELLSVHSDGDDDYDEIISVINELKDYTCYHFNNEENLFKKYSYNEYEKHKKEHDGFIEYLNSIDLMKIDDDQTAILKELLKKIISWIFNHIITTDFMYKDYLVNLGLR